MSKQRICMFTTSYSFFLYLLKFGYDENDIFIFTGWFPKEISKNLKHIQLPKVSFNGGPLMAPLNSVNGIIKNILGYIKFFYGYIKLRTLLFIKTIGKEKSIYGHAQTPFSYMFFENEDVNLIEDGTQNYVPDMMETHKINPIIDFLLHLCGIYFLNAKEALGSHKNTKKVYLTHENNHPLIKEKVELIDMQKSWDEKTNDEKTEILKIFNINYEDVQNLDNNIVLLLTQPLTGDDLLSYEDEVNIYKYIVNKFHDKKIIIKPHPRDEKDYSKIFPNIEIMEKSFPIELLNIIGFNPKIVASVVSTALLNFNDCELYVYDGILNSPYLEEARENLKHMLNQQNKTQKTY